MPILRLIALLLEYPDPHLWDNREEALAMIARDAPPLLGWATEYVAAPLIDRQSEWCDLFERGSSTSLLLFEHVHGLSLIHISEPTRQCCTSRMPSSA